MLREAGLASSTVAAQRRVYRLNPRPLVETAEWATRQPGTGATSSTLSNSTCSNIARKNDGESNSAARHREPRDRLRADGGRTRSSVVKFSDELLRRHVAEGVFEDGGYLGPINLVLT